MARHEAESTGLYDGLEIEALEAHAEGEPSRILLGLESLVQGDTMAERFAWCREHLDGLRRMMLKEPRGYPALCAVLVLPPVTADADLGLIVMEQAGFTPMSGSNTMCTVTALLEHGYLPIEEPVTTVTIDTAVGTITADATIRDGKVERVSVRNVPSFVVELDRVLDVPEIGKVPVDVVFGGQFFVQARVADVGLSLDPDEGRALAHAGALLKVAAREQLEVSHPLQPGIDEISLVMLHEADPTDDRRGRNATILTNGVLSIDDPGSLTGALDRSPCGTGTCGRMAALHARGRLAIGDEFIHESIIGTTFSGRLTGESTVGPYPAVDPTISGRAWVLGRSTWFIDPTEPFPSGFTLGDLWGPDST